MFRAIRNELYKIFTGKRIYVLSLVMLAVSAVMALIMKKISTLENAETVILNAPSYPIAFFTQIGSVLFPVLIIIAIGGLMSDEYRDGTLKLALLAPVTRRELLAAKIAVVLASNAFLLLVSLLGSYAFSALIFGWSQEFILEDIHLDSITGVHRALEFYGTVMIPAAAFGILVLLFSQLISNSGIVVGLCTGIYFFQLILQNMAPNLRNYLLTSYFSYGYAFHGPDKFKFLLAMLVVCSSYMIAALLISLIHFSRKDMLT